MQQSPTTARKLRAQTTAILQPLLLEICPIVGRAMFRELLPEIVAGILSVNSVKPFNT
jgi:hypothetical protein